MNCDGCGKKITSYYVIDNDLLLCIECFMKIYKQAIEDMIGVVVVVDSKEVMNDDRSKSLEM